MPSVSQLPTELLEFIFDFIHDKTAEPTCEWSPISTAGPLPAISSDEDGLAVES